jgi:hypothetical protein
MATLRPDLAALPFKSPGFVAETLLPPVLKNVKAGTLFYQDIVADQAAQTNRTLASAPTAYAIASASTTYTLAEKIHRAKVDASEIEQLGGLAAAQAKAARRGKRSVMKAVEDLVVAATFGDATIQHRDILSSFLNAVALAKEVIQDNADGRVALFGARRVVDRLKRYSEITGKMIYTGMLPAERAKDVRNITDDILAGVIGVDVVLAGPTTEWLGGGSAYDGYLGLAILPDPNVEQDEEVQFGRTFCMNVDGAGGLFEVTSFYSDDLISEVVDTRAWVNVLTFNKEACYILQGVDEANTVVTTAA